MFALRLSRVVNSLDCKPAQRLLSKITYSAGKVVETRDLIEFRCYRENEHHRNFIDIVEKQPLALSTVKIP